MGRSDCSIRYRRGTITTAMKNWAVMGLLFLPVWSAGAEPDCEAPHSTIEVDACAAIELERAEQELERYLEASRERFEEDERTLDALEEAQEDWERYRSSHCRAVYTLWREGTIRGVMELDCRTALTRERTHEVWRQYLTYPDGAPPVLPEPDAPPEAQ